MMANFKVRFILSEMSIMNDNISGWDDWSAAFAEWSDVSISELHGLMTGVMPACHAPDEDG